MTRPFYPKYAREKWKGVPTRKKKKKKKVQMMIITKSKTIQMSTDWQITKSEISIWWNVTQE